jgi:two-component system sensor histidine kinase ResE
VVRERTGTLTRLIQNLAMLQAIPGEVPVLRVLHLTPILRRVLDDFQRAAHRAGVTFEAHLPARLPPVLGDRERLKLAFEHLIDNAIKFSPDGGAVTVRAWDDEHSVYVSVADQGVGIPAEHVERIFERFYQVNGTTTRRFGGMGVGLALVWEIVQSHSGKIEVESEPGEGATFTLTLLRA